MESCINAWIAANHCIYEGKVQHLRNFKMIAVLNKTNIMKIACIFHILQCSSSVPIWPSGLDPWLLPGRPGSTPGMGRDASGSARTHQIIHLHFWTELTCHRKKDDCLMWLTCLSAIQFSPNTQVIKSVWSEVKWFQLPILKMSCQVDSWSAFRQWPFSYSFTFTTVFGITWWGWGF